jgi:TetR/AcrR family transcriptional regulator
MGRYHLNTFDRIPEEKRRLVLDAAAEEFAAGGFAAANINTIAANAGISVGSIYKYFGSKENCFLAVLEEGFSELETALSSALEDKRSPIEKIEAVLRLIPEHSRRKKSIVRLYNELTGEGLTDSVREFCERFEALSARAYSSLIREARDLGLAAADVDPEGFAFCMDNLFMMLQFSFSCDYFALRRRVYLGEGKADDDQFLIEQALRFIKGALGVPGVPRSPKANED